ncbi:MAG: hypothetical protein ACK55I_22040 [bacterium]
MASCTTTVPRIGPESREVHSVPRESSAAACGPNSPGNRRMGSGVARSCRRR